MYPIRRNIYNQEIFMIHREELISLISKTDNLLLREYINKLIKKYDWEVNFLNDLPYELRTWPNCYIGLSINDEWSRIIIELALQVRTNETLMMSREELIRACGEAYIEEQYELASQIASTKELYLLLYFPTIKSILQLITEDSLNYLLTHKQTHGCIKNDEKIVYYNGEAFVVLDIIRDTEMLPYWLVNGRKEYL